MKPLTEKQIQHAYFDSLNLPEDLRVPFVAAFDHVEADETMGYAAFRLHIKWMELKYEMSHHMGQLIFWAAVYGLVLVAIMFGMEWVENCHG